MGRKPGSAGGRSGMERISAPEYGFVEPCFSQWMLFPAEVLVHLVGMTEKISPKSRVELGVVPTHLGFSAFIPDKNGDLPRESNGTLRCVAGVTDLLLASPAKLDRVQISVFPGTGPGDIADLVGGLRELGVEVDFIMMVGGANPMDPADEEAVIGQLRPTLEAALEHGVRHVASTSLEEWMQPGAGRLEGADFDAALIQLVKLHLRAYQEAGLGGSCVEDWNIEFLRPGEFRTFTCLDRSWAFVHAANEALGFPFFKQLVDAAHCADSGLSVLENEVLIERIAAAGELGMFHASAKTTRGCFSTDDGWIGSLLAAAAKTGTLGMVYTEVFDHEDPALAPLRALDSGHGVDTRDGRTYGRVVADGLGDLAHRLNNLAARGVL